MAETVQETADRLAAFISQNSDIETGPGSVINELLIKLAASAQNEQYNKIIELDQGATITQVVAADAKTQSVVMDLVASNYNTSRRDGTKSVGKIKVTVSSQNEYILRTGLTFIQPGLNLNYKLIRDTRISAEPSTLLNELQLYTQDGFYYFILDVIAENAGPEYQVSSGTIFDISSTAYISDFVKAEAYGNFTSALAVENDVQLVEKIKTSLGNSRLLSAAGISKRFTEIYPGFQSLSICGANDAEMRRDKYNVLGIATFGKADVYVRSSLGPETLGLIKKATKIAQNRWSLTIDNTDAPGFYGIVSIVPAIADVSLGGTLLTSSATISYGMQMYQSQHNNEIANITEARYTKYQTAVINFDYIETPGLDIGSTLDFNLILKYQPNIRGMQDLLLADNERLACADYLVKAVIPCEVSLNIKLLKKRATDTFDSLNLQQLKKDIFIYINSIPFGGELHASNIVDICHNYPIKRVDLPIGMQGVIRCIDDTVLTISDADVLTIPTNVSKGVTPKTTAYFIDYYRSVGTSFNPIDNIGLTLV